MSYTLLSFPLYHLHHLKNNVCKLVPILSILVQEVFGRRFTSLWSFKIVKAVGSTIASTNLYKTLNLSFITGLILLSEHLTWNQNIKQCDSSLRSSYLAAQISRTPAQLAKGYVLRATSSIFDSGKSSKCSVPKIYQMQFLRTAHLLAEDDGLGSPNLSLK